MTPNGTVLPVPNPAPAAKSSKTVSAFAHKANSKKAESVSTTPHVRTEPNGTVRHVSEFHVCRVLHTAAVAVVVKPQFTLALQVPIGTVTDACT